MLLLISVLFFTNSKVDNKSSCFFVHLCVCVSLGPSTEPSTRAHTCTTDSLAGQRGGLLSRSRRGPGARHIARL